MTATRMLVLELLNQMHHRTSNWGKTPAEELLFRQRWNQLLKQAKAHEAPKEEMRVVRVLTEAMEMQDMRETEKLHISEITAINLWTRAIAEGDAYLMAPANTTPQSLPEMKPGGELVLGEEAFKQRAAAVGRALKVQGVSLSHCQVLAVLAAAEGHTSYQSLKAALPTVGAPCFCPTCGAAGTLKKVGTVFCEQGEYDGRSYEAEGDALQYSCTRCQGQFADWSGVDDTVEVIPS